MDPLKTLWMGNIENWMTENYINQILNKININPIKIRILQNDNPKSCCFIEFDTPEIANFILEKYNGVNKGNKNKKEKGNLNIKNNDLNNKFAIYVGNIPKDINSEELKLYFKNEYPSVINSKIIVDSNTKNSKGFGFVYFSNIYDFQKILKNKGQKYLKGNLLTIK